MSLVSRNAVAEGIVNNIRKTIIRDQLTDPRFYKEMSLLLDDLIKQKRNDTGSYEEFLKKAEALVRKLDKNQPVEGIPGALMGNRGAIAVYNNLPAIMLHAIPANEIDDPVGGFGDPRLALTLKIDRAIREKAPAGWRGDQVREAQVLNALFPILGRNREATLAVFEIIKNQPGYA